MRPYSRIIVGIFFLLSGIVFLAGCMRKENHRNKQLDTVIVAESTEDTNKSEEFYFGSTTSNKTWDININQAGYRKDDKKIAVIRNDCGSGTYQILNEEGNAVYTGPLMECYTDKDYNETLYYADFSGFKEEGSFYLTCGDESASPIFDINDGIYDEISKLAIKPFTTETYFMANQVDDSSDQEEEKQQERDLLVKKSQTARLLENNQTVDVSGGWWSSSNEGWFVVPSITSLANMMYLNTYFGNTVKNLPGQTNKSKIDLESMIQEEIEWLFKMQNTNTGGVYHKAATKDGSMDDDDQQLYISKTSTHATADFAGIMAKASMWYEDSNKKLAAQCEKAAVSAWKYLKTHTADVPFTNEEGVTSRAYTDSTDVDERFFAATELYLLTGEEEYLQAMKEYDLENESIEFGWSTVNGYAYFDYYVMSEHKDGEMYKKIKKLLLKEVEVTKESSDRGYLINAKYARGTLQQLLNRGMLLTLMQQEDTDTKASSKEEVHQYLNFIMGENPESKNALQNMLSDKEEQSLEVSSTLLVVLQGIIDR